MMFEPACLLYGKALTYPISWARRIGPECWRVATGSPVPTGIQKAVPTVEKASITDLKIDWPAIML
jgi:hypothetical protein